MKRVVEAVNAAHGALVPPAAHGERKVKAYAYTWLLVTGAWGFLLWHGKLTESAFCTMTESVGQTLIWLMFAGNVASKVADKIGPSKGARGALHESKVEAVLDHGTEPTAPPAQPVGFLRQ